MTMDQELQQVGKKIKILRIQRSITQTDLADMLGLSQTNLSNIENGKTAVTLQNLFKIRTALKCRMCDFFDEKESANPQSVSLEDIINIFQSMKSLKTSRE